MQNSENAYNYDYNQNTNVKINMYDQIDACDSWLKCND